jgi:HD-like signal output (HDOD) protein
VILPIQSVQPIPPPFAVTTPEPKRPWALRELPPFPPIATRLLGVLANEDSGLRGISDLINQDAAFASEVLRMANSPLFGLRSEISTVLQGVAFLGIERVKGLAFTVAIRGYLRRALTHDALRRSWRHNLACSLIAEELSGRLFLDSAQGYTAGLMHDIGRLAFLAAYPKECVNLFEAAEENLSDVRECERAMFEIDHCEAGCWLVKEWRLPAEFEDYTLRHHEPIATGRISLLGVTQASCALANSIGFSVLQSVTVKSPAHVFDGLPEWERGRLQPIWGDLAFRIASKVNAMEH